MAYEPLNLQNGQTLTAEDLQHMEEGIAGAGIFPVYRWNRLEREKQLSIIKELTVFFNYSNEYELYTQYMLIYPSTDDCTGESYPGYVRIEGGLNDITFELLGNEEADEINNAWQARWLN